jgi:hypothetical protein
MQYHLHSGNIFSWEAVCGVGDEHTGLAHRPVPHHHALDGSTGRHLQTAKKINIK